MKDLVRCRDDPIDQCIQLYPYLILCVDLHVVLYKRKNY